MTTSDWVGKLEKRVENLETESAQNLSDHSKDNAEMFKSIWAEINSIKLQNAKTVWIFSAVAAIGTTLLSIAGQIIAKKMGL